jgi:hypothetical protein
MIIPKEPILDILPSGKSSLLYYRIHKNYKSKREPPDYKSPSAFKYSPLDKKMSTNWNKYCKNIQEAISLGAPQSSENYGLVSLLVRDIRINPDLDKLSIKHEPLIDNPAHSNIIGLPKYEEISEDAYQEVQILLSRMAKWEILFE